MLYVFLLRLQAFEGNQKDNHTDILNRSSSYLHHGAPRQQSRRLPPTTNDGRAKIGIRRLRAHPARTVRAPSPLDTRRPLPKFEGGADQDINHMGGGIVASSGTPGGGLTHQQAAQRREQLKAKRRVPAAQRKRTKLSCDYCKTRRCKCQRLDQAPPQSASAMDTGADDEGLTPCKLCIEAGIQCVTTMPRKHRIYGSVESLDRRYRAIDALIRGLHPQLGAEPTAEEVIADAADDRVGGGKRQRSMSAAALLSPVSPEAKTIKSDRSDGSANLVRDPSGRPHYIGPAGSLAFFTRLRNLVATRSKSTSSELSSDPHPEHMTADLIPDPTMVYEGHNQRDSLKPPLSPSMFRGDSPTTSFSSHEGHANISELLRHCVPSNKVKLPEREVADRYVEAFFEHMHPNFVLFHRPTFQHVYEEIFRAASMDHRDDKERNDSIATASTNSTAGPGSSAASQTTYVSVGWLGCLYMIFIFGCRSLPQNNHTLDFQRRYYAEMTGLPQLLVTLSLPNVCALMLLSLHSNNTNDRTAAWTYHGAACRLAVALGMHRQDVSGSFHPITRELRKRVWWTLYCYEQNLCCSLGRPSAIDDREVDVDYPDENVLACAPGQPPGLAEELAKLWHLVGCIRRDVYDPAHCPSSRYNQAVQYLRRLVTWRFALPPDLHPAPAAERRHSGGNSGHDDLTSWRSVMILHVVYQCALGLLSRRFLLREVEASEQGIDLGATADGFVVTQLSRVCVTSAMRAVGLFVELWRGGAFNAICWFDVYWAYLTSMELTLRLVAPDAALPQSAMSQQQRPQSSAAGSQRGSTPEDAHHTWKFQPLPTNQQQEAAQSATAGARTDLGRELDALLAANRLVETHSVAELADAVRRLHDILKTVEMSGTNARFAKIANEFAKAMKLVDGRPTSTLFGNQLGSELEGVRVHENPATLRQIGHPQEAQQQQRHGGNDSLGFSSSNITDGVPPQQQQQNHQPQPMEHHQPLASPAWPNVPHAQPPHQPPPPLPGMHHPSGAPMFASDWDMVLAPEQWEQNQNLLTDMTDLNYPNWAWMAGGHNMFPYMNMGPTGGS
ncbi:hypothetical protein PG999_010299 [Apiospora kogelbergensis]|uniref:Xylanolytic transcriptional activator regulatory domain-containing protein n=1 Tax=Apiospora kogelbergensis TaxID=1337665 RepID=A0AAW0Q9P0_9PEZI